ncbi:amylosucrase [Mobilicoccus pelagius]|uniref:Amylosucrase n=1 Tax=Mobilicoccus pelagius NBRC 104925 TaxID=1089455 RepID=H5UP14_9MICO|nr:amylosucrase [Mobilicoccus pelagius]GAB47472.1 amylosucrase [Mobilicoccus pelagius NBRC 104925]
MRDLSESPRPSVDLAAILSGPLAGESPESRQMFEVRLDRWLPDLREGLELVLGDRADVDVDALTARLVRAAARAYADRDPELRRLDLERLVQPDHLQRPDMVGYAAYTERFGGTLRGVQDRLDHLEELGVTYLHLMPLLLPRRGDSDGGYAVADYRTVRPDLGTMEDLRRLTAAMRGRGMSLVLDLVLNHVAREHPWAEAARRGDARHRAYFHVFEDRTLPDAYERTLPEVFPDFAPGNFTWDDDLDAWVWTTFNAFQWDLNWSNPDVLAEFVDIVLLLANAGVEVLRLDAIAFLWKRMGTMCQGEPEVHAITQVLRTVARIACPALAFKAEAIVAPHDLVPYLGTGRFTGKVSDLAYHNTLMVQIWSMLATGDTRLTREALSQLPPAPTTSTWITYVRCHDDIGWAISDADAAAVGLSGFGHRSFLADWFTGDFPGSTARGLTFQYNPATGDRRTSGTAASLLGIPQDDVVGSEAAPHTADAASTPGEGGGLTAEQRTGLAKLRLAHAVIASFGGVPVIWSGDEVATPNDPHWADDPAHAADNRWAHRPRLEEARVARRHDPETVAGRAFTDLATLMRVRAQVPHLHASVPSEVGPAEDPGVLAIVRRHPLGTFVAVFNVTGESRSWPWWHLDGFGLRDATDALTGRPVETGAEGHLWLPPYGVAWLVPPTP